MAVDHPSDWTSKVAWMRDTGATKAEWAESSDKLLSVELGPVYPSADSDEASDETQQKPGLKPSEREAQRRHLSLAATGSLVRREPQ